jgi:hypothetical protein
MKLPLTMCLAYAGFSHIGSGFGRRYEFKISSPVAVALRARDGDGESGRDGGWDRRLLDDLLLWESPRGELRRPSSEVGDTGLLPLPCLLEAPLKRALLQHESASVAVIPSDSI